MSGVVGTVYSLAGFGYVKKKGSTKLHIFQFDQVNVSPAAGAVPSVLPPQSPIPLQKGMDVHFTLGTTGRVETVTVVKKL